MFPSIFHKLTLPHQSPYCHRLLPTPILSPPVARQREAWLQSIIEQRLLPPPRQGIIERITEAMAQLRRPEGSA